MIMMMTLTCRDDHNMIVLEMLPNTMRKDGSGDYGRKGTCQGKLLVRCLIDNGTIEECDWFSSAGELADDIWTKKSSIK